MNTSLNRRAFVGAALSLGALCTLDPKQALAVTAAQKQAEVRSVKAQLDAMAEDVSAAGDKYHQAMDAYQDATAKVEECKATIAEMTSRIGSLQERLDVRATSMYRAGAMSYLDVLLGVKTFDDFATVWDTLNSLNADDADLVASTKVAKSTLESAEGELVRQQEQMAQQLSSAEAYMNQVLAKQSEYDALYNSLSAEYQHILAEQEAAEARATAQRAHEQPTTPASDPAREPEESAGSDETVNPEKKEEAAPEQKKAEQSTQSSGSSASSSTGSASSSSASITTRGDDSATPSSSGATSNVKPQAKSSAPSLPTHGNVVDYAASRLGLPYVWAADGPNAFDCSGLVVWCYAKIGINLPHYTESLYSVAKARFSPTEAQPGDVLYKPGHVGISTGGLNCIEAMGTRWGVVRSCRGGWTAALRF